MKIISKKTPISAKKDNDIRKINFGKLTLPAGFTITAHAGAMDYPPNTEIALVKAIESGADIVEVDVSFRPDNTPVIIHSERPSKKQGVLFENALKIVAKHENTMVNLDLKSFVNLPAIDKLVNEFNLQKRAFFTGVNEKFVSTVRLKCPDIPLYLNASIDTKSSDNRMFAINMAEKLLSLGCVGLNCNYKNISRPLVDCLHENGLLVSVWTVDNELDMYKMLSLSPDNITTKKPVQLKDIINDLLLSIV